MATYNVRNYAPMDRMTEAGFRKDYPKPESEKRALRGIIRALRADILVLQEMGDRPYLDELRADLRAEGLDYPQAASVQAGDRVRRVALLSRLPLVAVHPRADVAFTWLGRRETVRRGLLEAEVATAAGPLAIFAFHLKSRLTEDARDPEGASFRAGEAAAVRDCVLGRFPDPARARFVLLGDCNDSASSRPLRLLGRRGRTAVALLLGASDTRGEVWTEWDAHDQEYGAIDHILVSPGLAPAVEEGKARVYGGPDALAASDHRPVYVDLQLSAPRPGPSVPFRPIR